MNDLSFPSSSGLPESFSAIGSFLNLPVTYNFSAIDWFLLRHTVANQVECLEDNISNLYPLLIY